MRAIMVMYDSLSKDFLSAYGNVGAVTPNFDRLLERCVRFDNFYVGSMPCMPARRELHTGRYNFLHRGWGPVEPFDDSMPEILKNNGVYTHLVTDHYHYLEDGGCTYHNRYSSWECFRGQEGDAWKGRVKDPAMPKIGPAQQVRAGMSSDYWRQHWVNRKYLDTTEKMPQSLTFDAAIEFIDTNMQADNWFLQIETFDPHEPFHVQKEYLERFETEYAGEFMDWPAYVPVDRDRDPVEHVRAEYQALVAMCDEKLGMVLDIMDQHDMWKDTMLIVNTDHGFLLGEHEWWGKNAAPMFNEIACIPFFIHDPRYARGGICGKLAQTIDIAPTLLDFFGVPVPKDMQGVPLRKAYADREEIHPTVLYGQFGGCVNITDGDYTYMRAPRDCSELCAYTLMPTNMRGMYSVEQLKNAEMAEGFSFTKGARVMKVVAPPWEKRCSPCDMLFHIKEDPGQTESVYEPAVITALCNAMRRQFTENEAPKEMYARMGLPVERAYTRADLEKEKEQFAVELDNEFLGQWPLTERGRKYLHYIFRVLSPTERELLSDILTGAAPLLSEPQLDVNAVKELVLRVAHGNNDMDLAVCAEDYAYYIM